MMLRISMALCLALFFFMELTLAQTPYEAGVDTTLYPDGTVREIFGVDRARGVRHGHYRYCYPGGVIGQEGAFADGLLEGPFSINNPDGSPKVRCHYHKGRRDGEMLLYNEDGRLVESLVFKMDQVNGRNVRYYSTGEVNIVANRVGDVWQGEAITYYRSGSIQARTQYVDGFKNGSMTTYFEDGTVMNVSNFIGNIRCGDYSAYYSNGNLAEHGEYLNGERAGYWVSFHPDGQTVYTTGCYLNGNYTGLWRIYNPDGTLRNTVVFQEAYEHGPVQLHDKAMLYFMGSPVR